MSDDVTQMYQIRDGLKDNTNSIFLNLTTCVKCIWVGRIRKDIVPSRRIKDMIKVCEGRKK